MHSLLKRGVAYATALTFLCGQISGCLTVPAVPSEWKSLIDDSTTSFKGIPPAGTYQNSLAGKAVFDQLVNGPIGMGYNTSDFQTLYSSFTAAKRTIEATDGNFTQSQFLDLSQSTARLLSYVDTVEGLSPKKARMSLAAPNLDAYTILPGEKLTFDIDGFCLDKELNAAPAGELFRLESVADFIDPQMLPTYHSIIQQHQERGVRGSLQSYRADPDTQTLMWALRGMKTGQLDQKMLKAMPDRQKDLLRGSDPAAYSKLMSQAQTKEVIRGLNEAWDKSMFGQGYAALKDLAGGNPDNFLSNPSVMGDSGQLASAMEQWQARQQISGRQHVASPHSSPYTLLDEGVAARAVGTNQLRTNVEVVNMSGAPFKFEPAAYVFNSRSQSQAVAPGRWNPTGATQVAHDAGGDSEDVAAMLKQDFAELASMKGLDTLAPKGALGKALTGMGDLFKSKLVGNLLQSAPIVGNMINLGMLMTGKNLDGSDMSATDYIMAGIGVIPVAGNVAKLLRPAGAKIFAKELGAIDRFYERYDKPLLAADLLTTDTAEYMIGQASAPSWMTEATQQATAKVGGAIKAQMPQTAQYMHSQGIVL